MENARLVKQVTITEDVDSEGTLGQLKEQVDKLIKKYGSDTAYDFEGGYSNVTFLVYTKEIESDADYNKRIAKEEKARERRRKAYEKLKQEFGD